TAEQQSGRSAPEFAGLENVRIDLRIRRLIRAPHPFLAWKGPLDWEPPIGIEPMTHALREAWDPAPGPLPAQTAALASLDAPSAQRASGSRSTTRSTACQSRHACVPTYRKRRGRRRATLLVQPRSSKIQEVSGSIVLSRLVIRERDQHVGI